MVRNPIGLRDRLTRLRGSPVELDLAPYDATLAEIDRLEGEHRQLSDAELVARSGELVARARDGVGLGDLMVPAYALAREAARRTVGLRPFAVQVVAAIALHRGRVVDMQTGEGKTLVAVLPAYLNALTGRGVHVLTFNDYLARRDAEWMGPAYRALGLAVGFVQEGMSPAERRRAYRADVTYVTAKEAGFDFLRDLLALRAEELVHRPLHIALVDEADSLLIDEARIPLVIAGSVDGTASSTARMAELAAELESGVDFEIDEYGRHVELSEAGIERAERALGCANLVAEESYHLLTELHCALYARALLHRDGDYIVRGGRIEFVDEFTGRVVEDRHWPDGLQAALEAKEGLERSADGRILGSITLHHFLGTYPRLCGMSGTARQAAREIEELYGLAVVVIPTHRPMIRTDRPDLVFTHREAKERAVIEEIHRAHETGRPVLVGTLTIEESERLAEKLRSTGVACEVLNARNDAREAEIVARAGTPGAVTISTNMAGRGTDIRLGGEHEDDRERVVSLGGLYVIGTNRHESRRVDLQLRGRAGRQGDPGESRFFLSLDDDLLVRYGVRELIPSRLLPGRRDGPLEGPVVRHEIARVQRIIEGQNGEIRRAIWQYAWPLEEQRRLIHGRRQDLLVGRQRPDLWRQDGPRFEVLVGAVGEEQVRRAETTVTLTAIDRAWSDHLARVADLREGNHLVGLGGEDPLTRFAVETAGSFRRAQTEIEDAVVAALRQVRAIDGTLDLGEVRLEVPSSTWTYLVDEDPFRGQLITMLTGPGRTTFAIGAALHAPFYLLLWLVVERFFRRRSSRPRHQIDGDRIGSNLDEDPPAMEQCRDSQPEDEIEKGKDQRGVDRRDP